jgi:N-acetylneuraminate epimerase
LARPRPNVGSIFLLSGAGLKPGDDGKPERVWLKDAYRYTPGQGWQRIADLPRVAVAAPSPAPALRQAQLLVLGGDDGAQAKLPQQSHTGFRRDVLAYQTTTNKWSTLDELPFSLVTTPAVLWHDRVVIPGGEQRPGIRSNKVWAATIVPQHD